MAQILNIDDPRLWQIHHMDRQLGDPIPGWHMVIPSFPKEALLVEPRHDAPDCLEAFIACVEEDGLPGDALVEYLLVPEWPPAPPQRFVKIAGVAVYFTDDRAATLFKVRYG